jgi:hypothetical protein
MVNDFQNMPCWNMYICLQFVMENNTKITALRTQGKLCFINLKQQISTEIETEFEKFRRRRAHVNAIYSITQKNIAYIKMYFYYYCSWNLSRWSPWLRAGRPGFNAQHGRDYHRVQTISRAHFTSYPKGIMFSPNSFMDPISAYDLFWLSPDSCWLLAWLTFWLWKRKN